MSVLSQSNQGYFLADLLRDSGVKRQVANRKLEEGQYGNQVKRNSTFISHCSIILDVILQTPLLDIGYCADNVHR